MARGRGLGDRLAAAFADYEAGRQGAALRAARALLAEQPALAGARYLLGLIRLDQGSPAAALDELVKAEEGGASPALDFAIARAQRQLGNDDAALARLAALDSVAAHQLAAEILAARDPAAAAARLARAAALAPDRPGLWNDLGAAERAAGRPAAARDALLQAVALDPGYARAWGNLAAVRLDLGEPALADAEAAVALDPAHAGLRRTLALARHKAGDHAGAAALLRALVQAAPQSAAAWLDLGSALAGQDDAGAADAFAKALACDPGSAAAAVGLGEAKRRRGHADAAAAAYRRALAIDPQDRAGAGLGLSLLGADAVPAAAPAAFVRRLFDDYAPSFDRALAGLGYAAPALLRAAVDAVRPEGPLAILDLGCGTGLGGAAFADRSTVLDGIDLSPRMLEQARARGLYRRLIEGELVPAMAGLAPEYDLVLAADVLVYVGDLTAVFAAAAARLRPGGLLAATVEHAESGVVLHDGRRFAHGADHLQAALATAGLDILSLAAVATRRDRGAPVPGLLVVATRPRSSSAPG